MKILFIGNSFTSRNNLPGLLSQLAEARGRRCECHLIAAGGASLRMHWNKGVAQEEMQRKRYDFVVLQEQSTLPIKNPKRMHENIRLFDTAIKATGSGTALYLTWARQNVPETQKQITEAYTTIGSELGATVVPVGVAWEQFIRGHRHPVLHDADRSHPSLAGSYLAACVFLTVLMGENPVGITSDIAGLTRTDAESLQKCAEFIAPPG